MMKKELHITLKYLAVICVLSASVVFAPRMVTAVYAGLRIDEPEEVAKQPVAIVFGAGLTRDGHPTRVLRDRVETAAYLYFTGKADVLLMSGDNRYEYYNEPQAMKEYAISLGVPEDVIVLDYAGRRTYDTCYRAHSIFQVENAIVVTQGFHLPRAVYTCNHLGLDVRGVAAENHYFLKRSRAYWNIRELLATPVAFWEIHITQPLPILGDPEPIGAYAPHGDQL